MTYDHIRDIANILAMLVGPMLAVKYSHSLLAEKPTPNKKPDISQTYELTRPSVKEARKLARIGWVMCFASAGVLTWSIMSPAPIDRFRLATVVIYTLFFVMTLLMAGMAHVAAAMIGPAEDAVEKAKANLVAMQQLNATNEPDDTDSPPV